MFLLLQFIAFILMIVTWIIVIQVILSLLISFNVINTHNDFVRGLYTALERMTDPIYRPIRRILPDFGPLDLSPMVVLLVLFFLRGTVIPYLMYQTGGI
ncbi:YggT family protein [Sphingomonas gilva]|uniref:YggT family protein n=1 Tax=Sphingomonas gilva TaxID=2305907 RepID=A0A396RKX3_9SPHN|nr:YggT family protein [Sphingomonas gilva]RHW16739.1 YggT family protein [Sphingomonas gilva]